MKASPNENLGSHGRIDFGYVYGLEEKNDRNGGIWQSGISKSLPEYVQHLIIVQSSLHENVVNSVCACMYNAAYIIYIIWNPIFGLDAWYHIRFNISCGVAVTGRSHQKNIQVIYLRGGEGGNVFEGWANF